MWVSRSRSKPALNRTVDFLNPFYVYREWKDLKSLERILDYCEKRTEILRETSRASWIDKNGKDNLVASSWRQKCSLLFEFGGTYSSSGHFSNMIKLQKGLKGAFQKQILFLSLVTMIVSQFKKHGMDSEHTHKAEKVLMSRRDEDHERGN